MKNNESQTIQHLKDTVQALFRITAELNLVEHPDPGENARLTELSRMAAIEAIKADRYLRESHREF